MLSTAHRRLNEDGLRLRGEEVDVIVVKTMKYSDGFFMRLMSKNEEVKSMIKTY